MASNPCCESGRAVVTDPVTGQAVFSCQQCDSHSLVYPRLGSSVPTGPYAPYSEQTYPSVGMESPTFYSSLGTPYVLKEGSSEVSGWQSMAQPTGYYPYDPSLAAYGYGYDLNGARRKNATREATTTLKTWLNDHKKNPYPTKGEKIMLAIITKMTLTQVSTWFANARRRLKKENKITWNSKGKDDDDDEDGKLSDVDDDKDVSSDRLDGSSNDGTSGKAVDSVYEKSADGKDMIGYDKDPNCAPLVPGPASGLVSRLPCDNSSALPVMASQPLHLTHQLTPQHHMVRYPVDLLHQERLKGCVAGLDKDLSPTGLHSSAPIADSLASNSSLSQNKPKIWSLADTATCKTPPTTSLAPPRPNCATLTTGTSSLQTGSVAPNWAPATSAQRPVSGLTYSLPPFQVTSSPASAYANPYHSAAAANIMPLPPQTKPISASAVPHHSAMAVNPGCDVATPGMAGRTSGQCSNGSFAELQTDTPPQTPPNHKYPSVPNYGHHGGAAIVPGAQGSSYGSGDHYIGQRSLLSSVSSRLHEFQDP